MILIATSCHLTAQQLSVELESGITSIIKNNFSDNEGGSFIQFTSDFDREQQLNFRMSIFYTDLKKNNQFFIKLVFLNYDVSGILSRDIRFEGRNFSQGDLAVAQSKFNGYRVGWSHLFRQNNRFSYRLGFTANIRDGLIAISDEEKRVQFSNDGGAIVPLLNAGFEYRLLRWVSISSSFEGLYLGPNGNLIDVDASLDSHISPNWTLKIGFRRIQGKVDLESLPFNDLAYHATMLAIQYRFDW